MQACVACMFVLAIVCVLLCLNSLDPSSSQAADEVRSTLCSQFWCVFEEVLGA